MKRTCLRSGPIGEENLGIEYADEGDEIVQEQTTAEILLIDTVVALATSADDKSTETFYLIKITKEELSKDTDDIDDYGNMVKKGVNHLEGVFFERNSGSDRDYHLTKKRAFFYKESIAYPFVQLAPTKKCFRLSDDEFMIITQYVEQSYHTALF